MRCCALVLPLWFVMPACGSSGSSDSDSDTEGSGTEDSSSGSAEETTSAETSTTGPSETGDSSDDGPPTEPPPATGIKIVDVTADQGIRIPVVIGGDLVDGPQRVGALIKDRPILLRAFWEVEPGYEQPESMLGFDPDRARALLADAGYPAGVGFPSVGILFNTSESHKQIAELVADQLRRELGIEVRAYNQANRKPGAVSKTIDNVVGYELIGSIAAIAVVGSVITFIVS